MCIRDRCSGDRLKNSVTFKLHLATTLSADLEERPNVVVSKQTVQFMNSLLLIAALIVLGYALVSAWLPKTIITAPMVFVACGIAASSYSNNENYLFVLESLAELTLVVLLFTDASRINARALLKEPGIPLRLLGIGLPLTIALGFVLAKLLFPTLSWAEAALLSAILAPTDAALGQAVVSSKVVPLRIRQALNVESGLNDGVVFPVVILFASLAALPGEHGQETEWLMLWGKQITLGPFVGVATAICGGLAVEWTSRIGFVSPTFKKLSGVALAVLAWALAGEVGGNGFIAAFTAGLVVGVITKTIKPALQEFGETEGQLLSLLSFSLFGATMIWPAIVDASLSSWGYAILSLTLVRLIPVALSLRGMSLRLPTELFLGWFGPRGLASLIFILLVTNEHDFSHEPLLLNTVVLTALLSVVAHGISAIPAAFWYGRIMQREENANCCEQQTVHEHSIRYGAIDHN